MHGCTCVRCGRSANRLIAWEDNGGGLHIDLFHRTGNGNLVMMNRDHIIPKSKRGSNSEWNYQTMCVKCNTKKANNETAEDLELAKFRSKWRNVHTAIHNRFWHIVPRWARTGVVSRFMTKLLERHSHQVSYAVARVLP